MLSIHSYDLYIFDCDGVILDSNQLKIDAMRNTLTELSIEPKQIESCIKYFTNNFGKSRFHHVDVFFDHYITAPPKNASTLKKEILSKFSEECRSLYLIADTTPFFLDFLMKLKGKKFIASGSEQSELRDVFEAKNLRSYFDNIYGSPIRKQDIVNNILINENPENAILFGDALSDLEAAKANRIDFVAFTPYSNVKDKLITETKKENYFQADNWSDLL